MSAGERERFERDVQTVMGALLSGHRVGLIAPTEARAVRVVAEARRRLASVSPVQAEGEHRP